MQIRIEIDVKPEELRRFLGLPDVAGLQEDVIAFLRDKLGAASESFDPAGFVKDNLQTLRNTSAWKKFVAVAKSRAPRLQPEGEAEEAAPVRVPRPARAAAKKRAKRKPAAKSRPARKKASPVPEPAAEEPTA